MSGLQPWLLHIIYIFFNLMSAKMVGKCWRGSLDAVGALLSSSQNAGVTNTLLATTTKHSTIKVAM